MLDGGKGLGDWDMEVWRLIGAYNTCRIGTGGMGFNWPSGTWQESPSLMVEAFRVIDSTIAEHLDEERERQQARARMSKPR